MTLRSTKDFSVLRNNGMPFIKKIIKTPWTCGILCAIGYLLCWYVLPLIKTGGLTELVLNTAGKGAAGFVFLFITLFTAGIAMLLMFGMAFKLVEQRLPAKGYIVLFLCAFAGMSGIILSTAARISRLSHAPFAAAVRFTAANMNDISSPFMGVYSLLLVVLAVAFGYLISFVVREKNLLVPIMLCCAIVDVWTVYGGFVKKVMTEAPAALGAVSGSVPAAGAGKFSVISTIGAGDFIFPALVFACVFRFGFRPAVNFWLIFAFLFAGMALILTGVLPHLPALVPVCAATLIADFREFSLSRREWAYMGIVFALLVAVLFFLHRIVT